MLDQLELADVAEAFGGVAEEQVRRDHLISHLLHTFDVLDLPVVFFGGTALARTHLATPQLGGRLSEDIDLYTSTRSEVARVLEADVPHQLRKEFPSSGWDPPPTRIRSTDPAQLVTGDELRVRVQLLDTDKHQELPAWPTELRELQIRYSDVPPTFMRVPSLTAFAGMKTVAFMDRGTARDLYDLAALARLGALTSEVAQLIRRVSGWPVIPQVFNRRIPVGWHEQLSHQTRQVPTAQDCLDTVHDAYARALGWSTDGDLPE